jgi:hypothetical protein
MRLTKSRIVLLCLVGLLVGGVWGSGILASSDALPTPVLREWVHTRDGWEKLPWPVPPSVSDALPHPLVIASFMALFSGLVLVAFRAGAQKPEAVLVPEESATTIVRRRRERVTCSRK